MAYVDDHVQAKPVTDWLTDWDWLDESWGPNAIEIWDSVREQCPVATTTRYGRAVMPVTMDAVATVARDTTNFSSEWVGVAQPDAERQPAPPITSDPPDHQAHRRILLPAFNPRRIKDMEADMRIFCRKLISDLGGADMADAAEHYAQHIPVHGICQITGAPEADADLFRSWIHRNFQLGPRDNTVRAQVYVEMTDYFEQQLKDRMTNPTDDLTTEVAHAEIDGVPVDWTLKIGYMRLLLLAGIDTTWSAIGSGLWHFGQHNDQVKQLVAADDDDLLWQTASEEVLRFYAPVTMARKVVADTEVAGCPVSAGDQVLLTFPAANHDPKAFEAPDEFRIDRAKNRHLAFGLGIHRCVGSNLARMELTVGLQEWLRAFPDYALDLMQETSWANGQIRGPRNIPVHLNR